jgi:hypothetical protein
MGEHQEMQQWFKLLGESWVVRGAISLLGFLILLIVIFEMNWLSTVVVVLSPVVFLISLVACVSELIRMFKK